MALTKRERRYRIKQRIRKKAFGTAEKPRMSVYRSNKGIYVQFIDDLEGRTLAAASSQEKTIQEKENLNKAQQAEAVGELAAKKASEKGIEQVLFDRNGYLYHGRVKALADGARKGGLKF
jgi:large subunit ribosomal protein L18